MCQVCGCICGHLKGCPEGPEPIPALHCDLCGEPINAGDRFVELPDGQKVCADCIDNMTSEQAIELCGGSFSIANAG